MFVVHIHERLSACSILHSVTLFWLLRAYRSDVVLSAQRLGTFDDVVLRAQNLSSVILFYMFTINIVVVSFCLLSGILHTQN